jgi:hypothetical protein
LISESIDYRISQLGFVSHLCTPIIPLGMSGSRSESQSLAQPGPVRCEHRNSKGSIVFVVIPSKGGKLINVPDIPLILCIQQYLIGIYGMRNTHGPRRPGCRLRKGSVFPAVQTGHGNGTSYFVTLDQKPAAARC